MPNDGMVSMLDRWEQQGNPFAVTPRKKKATENDGGPGSGNFGHKGRPGEVGGSSPDGSVDCATIDGADRIKAMDNAPVGSIVSVSGYDCEGEELADDPFEKIGDNAWATSTMKAIGAAPMTSEELSDYLQENVDSALEENDPDSFAAVLTPKNNESDYNGECMPAISRETYSKMKKQFSRNSGENVSDEDTKELVNSIYGFTGMRSYQKIIAAQMNFGGRSKWISDTYFPDDDENSKSQKAYYRKEARTIEKALSISDKYTGVVMRGIGFELNGNGGTPEEFENFMKKCKPGKTMSFGTLSSWTTSRDAAEFFAKKHSEENAGGDESPTETANVIMRCKSKTGVDISQMSDLDEGEVLFSKEAKFKVKSVVDVPSQDPEDNRITVHSITVEMEEV